MPRQDSAVTIHMFIRPGTPPGAAAPVVMQLAELFEFGVIGPGSKVWVNTEIPGALWVLSDRSSFVRIVDVPAAGWVRIAGSSRGPEQLRGSAAGGRFTPTVGERTVVWGTEALIKTPGFIFSTSDLPIPAQPHDTVTLVLRNSDSEKMRCFHSGKPQPMDDFEITHRSMRVIDLKLGGFMRKSPLSEPLDYDVHHAAVRGMDLLAATEGPAMHRVIRENLESFTTVIDADGFNKIRTMQQRVGQITEEYSDPVIQRIESLDAIGPFRGYGDEDATVAAV